MSDVRRQKKLFSTQFEVRQSFLLTNYEFRLTGLVKLQVYRKDIKIVSSQQARSRCPALAAVHKAVKNTV